MAEPGIHDTVDGYSVPSTVTEVEKLVRQLYLPNSPARLSQLQAVLQAVQRSSEGWQVADALLGSDDDKARFFGALTFTVKLNLDWTSLDEEASTALLYRLISWLVRLSYLSEGPLVLKKLCSTLVIYFIKFHSSWTSCIRHLVCSLSCGEAVQLSALSQYEGTEELTARMNPARLHVLMWFSSNLVDEIGKLDYASLRGKEIHATIAQNIDDVGALLTIALRPELSKMTVSQGDAVTLAGEAMRCLHSWVKLFYQEFIYVKTDMSSLEQLSQYALRYLTNEDTYEPAAEFFTEVLSHYSDFIGGEDDRLMLSIFTSPWAQEYLQRLLSGCFDIESVNFGRLLLAYGDYALLRLEEVPKKSEMIQLMQMMHLLMQCSGYAVVEDEICALAIEFWGQFAEDMADKAFEENKSHIACLEFGKHHLRQAIEESCAKCRLPEKQETATWDVDSKRAFKEFRKDVADLVRSAYVTNGARILEQLVTVALQSLESMIWEDLEAALFCLNALGDVTLGEKEEAALGQLFGSSLFARISSEASVAPEQSRQTFVQMLGYYSNYIERHAECLPPALTFLFQVLGTPSMASVSSRAILDLCRSCRKNLTGERRAFLVQYEMLLNSSRPDALVKERVLGAIASVTQALEKDSEKAEMMAALLSFIERDAKTCLDSFSDGMEEVAVEAGLAALDCLASVGKGLQSLDDLPIVLDGMVPLSSFWTRGPGEVIQSRIVLIVESITETLHDRGEIIEAACAVIKTGIGELTPSPFVFPPSFTTGFILKSNIHTPRLEHLISIGYRLISTHTRFNDIRLEEEASTLLSHVIDLIQQLEEPSRDPDIAQASVDFLYRLINGYAHLFFQIEPKHSLEFMFMFTLKCLNGQDMFPKRSACNFWAAFISSVDKPEPVQKMIDQVLDQLGPLLSESLILMVGGKASRSELDNLSDPLRSMIFKRQRQAKPWLEAALAKPGFPSEKVNTKEKHLFLQKLLTLRGGTASKKVIRDFWLACRGSDFAYTS